MDGSFKTVDLFAGPGGLAEGFSRFRDDDGNRAFDIALSVEKEPSAFRTLRLRSFVRRFEQPPQAYYEYMSGRLTRDELVELHPAEWQAAVAETRMLELGTPEATAELDPRLDEIAESSDGRAILVGGPPCQAYSLVGRARNRGIKGYDPAEDHRHFLYKEYIRILGRLKPAAFVMENVKGMLSARVGGHSIFDRVLEDLRSAGGEEGSYTLVPLVTGGSGKHGEHIIRAERYGIPQRRHRVILVGIRSDRLKTQRTDGLDPALREATVASVLEAMPRLRSGLSRGDSETAWREEVGRAYRAAAAACRKDGSWLSDVARRLAELGRTLDTCDEQLARRSTDLAGVPDNVLGAWLADPNLRELPNHDTRGHMPADLARYAFASVFAECFSRSPKADEFPAALAPDHRNWESGKFADRFRVQCWDAPSTTVTSHISKDGHYFIHPDPTQCRSLTVREAARLQTFPDNYFFEGNRTEQYVQVGNAVPPLLAHQIAGVVHRLIK